MDCPDYSVSRETFTIDVCGTCGFKFTNPRPAENEMGRYYESDDYVSHSGTKRGLVNKIYNVVRNYTISAKVKMVQGLNRNKDQKSLLDIGCGTGEFLNACKAQGWKVQGIEPSPGARQKIKENYGIDAKPSDLLFTMEGRFSIITMWHVLEHVHQLDRSIEAIKKLLAPKGRLIVALPNCDSWDAKKYGAYWAAWDVPRHLYHFRKVDVEKLFSRHQMRVVEVKPMYFDSFYVSMLSEKYKNGGSGFISGMLSGLISNTKTGQGRGHSSRIYILEIITN